MPARLTNADVDRGLAEIDRHLLPVNIGNVQQCYIAKRIKLEELLFGEPLLSQRACECASSGRKRRGRRADLKNFTPRDHAVGVASLAGFAGGAA